MSIADAVSRIRDNFDRAYDICSLKGATLPTSGYRNSNNLPATVRTIPAEGSGDMLDNYIMGSINIIETNAAVVKDNAFNDDILIKEVKLNAATEIGKNAFYRCSELTSISMPYVTSIALLGLYGCSKLTTLIAPALRTTANRSIDNCTSLSKVDASSLVDIGIDTFVGCTNLTTLIIRTSTKCRLYDKYSFEGTPFASIGAGGTLYVPSNLINSYQSDSNWGALNITVKSLEEIPT